MGTREKENCPPISASYSRAGGILDFHPEKFVIKMVFVEDKSRSIWEFCELFFPIFIFN